MSGCGRCGICGVADFTFELFVIGVPHWKQNVIPVCISAPHLEQLAIEFNLKVIGY
jgi:hypothetical protein